MKKTQKTTPKKSRPETRTCRYLLVDGSHLLARALHIPEARDLKDGRGVFTGGMLVFLRSLRWSIAQCGLQGRCFVVWDGAHSARRKALYPDYKQRIKPTVEIRSGQKFDFREQFTRQRFQLCAALAALGVGSVVFPEREADDVLYRMADLLERRKQNWDCVVMTDDKDLLQVLTIPGVRVYRAMKGEEVTAKSFWASHGYKPELYALEKALLGDPSDNIPGVPGVGEKTARQVVAQCRSLTGLVEALERSDITIRRADAIRANLDLVKRNLELITLSLEEFTGDEMHELREMLEEEQSPPNLKLFFSWAKKYDLRSITSEPAPWAQVVRALT